MNTQSHVCPLFNSPELVSDDPEATNAATVNLTNAPIIMRKMLPGETCQRVSQIDWSLVRED